MLFRSHDHHGLPGSVETASLFFRYLPGSKFKPHLIPPGENLDLEDPHGGVAGEEVGHLDLLLGEGADLVLVHQVYPKLKGSDARRFLKGNVRAVGIHQRAAESEERIAPVN